MHALGVSKFISMYRRRCLTGYGLGAPENESMPTMGVRQTELRRHLECEQNF